MIITHVGEMTIERWIRFWFEIGARVFVNGEDVTDRCLRFNDMSGEAEVLVHDDDGQLVIDQDDVLRKVVTGRVEVHIP